MIIGDCTKWDNTTMKTFVNTKKLYQSDSNIFVNVSDFLKVKLKDTIIKRGTFTWHLDSLSQVENNPILTAFFKKNQIESGMLNDSNKAFFYFSNVNSIEVYENCDAIRYRLTYLKNDTPPLYNGVNSYMNEKSKWYKIGNNWYLWAYINR